MRHPLTRLLLSLAVLLLCVQQSSARMVVGLENRVGGFESALAMSSWDDGAAMPDYIRDAPPCDYDLASDVRDGPNLYAYVKQNPWTSFDPLGLETENELTQMHDDAVKRRDYYANAEKNYREDQKSKGTWKGRLHDDVDWELYSKSIAAGKAATSASARLERLRAAATAIAVATRLSGGEFDAKALDDNSELCADGAKLANYSGYALNVAAFYGGRAVGAAFEATLGKITGAVAASRWGVSPAASGLARQTTILGENMALRVQPFAIQTGAETLGFGCSADEWAAMTPQQRYKLNDGMLRARIGQGDSFRYIGQDPLRPDAVRNRFDLTGSELLRLNDRGISYDAVNPVNVYEVLGNPAEVTR